MKSPLISCIMPTANRLKFIPSAIDNFLKQDYPNTELLIFDDGDELASSLIPDHPNLYYYYSKIVQKIGPKRNFLCKQAKGEIIVHLDDDDWYAPDWVTKEFESLTTTGADITGLNNIHYFSTLKNKDWNYKDIGHNEPWVYGGTLAYLKSFWEKHPFKNMQTGEDNDFVWSYKGKVCPHDYTSGYTGIIHNSNIGIKLYENPREKMQQEKWVMEISSPKKIEANTPKPTNDNLPLVTCIMPTANRANFIDSAISNFLGQDYSNKELVIIDDGQKPVKDLIPNDPRIRYFYFPSASKIGIKRNIACERANGEFIIHWDDDDWYASDWISYEVDALTNSGADICGINQVQFYSPSLNKYWMTMNRNSKTPWLTGASLIYRKSFWNEHRFKDLQSGEDDDYIRNNEAKIFAHDYFEGFIATIHSNNTSSIF